MVHKPFYTLQGELWTWKESRFEFPAINDALSKLRKQQLMIVT